MARVENGQRPYGDVLCTHLEGAIAAMAAKRDQSGRSKLRPDGSHG